MFKIAIALLSAVAALTSIVSSQSKVSEATLAKGSNVKLGLIEGRVVQVDEGDSLLLRSGGETIRLRLQALDAPDAKQELFKRSRNNLSDLILNKEVKAVLHKRDSNGAYIASVYRRGRDVAVAQLESGYAWHFKMFAYEQTAEDRKAYAQAEAKAREIKAGIWENDKAVAPWVFRGDSKAADKPKPAGPVAAASDTAGKKFILGPRGGCYFVSDSGRKVYVKEKELCTGATTAKRP